MESPSSKASKTTKRSGDALTEEEQTVSTTKKAKLDTSSDVFEDEVPKSEKGAGLSKVNSDNQSSSQIVLKRSSDVLSEPLECRSPSKKKKTAKIQEEKEAIDDDQCPFRDAMDKKKKRMRKKALLKAVLEQMEFYFSDCNLSKDRFLRKLYDSCEDGYIYLSVFKKFHKLQSLHKDGVSGDLLCKALSKSKLLEVNEDHTKVKRRSPLVELDQNEVDRRTVYVERLPAHASHSWVHKVFSQCGRVCYVSLPKYKTTKEIKGFAFVEFNSAEEAEKACKLMNNPPPAKTEEKAGKFPKWNKTLKSLQKSAPPIKPVTEDQDSNEENVQSDSKEEQTPTPTKKRKKKKNLRRKSDESEEKGSVSENQEERKKKKKKKKKPVSGSEGGTTNDKNITDPTKVDGGNKSDEKICETSEREESDKDSDLKTKEKENALGKKSDGVAGKKKKKKKKKKKGEAEQDFSNADSSTSDMKDISGIETSITISDKIDTKSSDQKAVADIESKDTESETVEMTTPSENVVTTDGLNKEVKMSRKERKLLRQEDIRRKKAERELEASKLERKEEKQSDLTMRKSIRQSQAEAKTLGHRRERMDSLISESSETDSPSKVYIKRDGSQVTSILGRSRKLDVVKKVEFDPVPITTEFIERKEIRRRKKQKKDIVHLRVLSKKEWLGLRAEYLSHQKSHMTALKESLRELRMQENGDQTETMDNNGRKHVDLTTVFGTKRMKPSVDVKLAHLEEIKFIPNVIVQWKCSHDIKRNKIKTMFQEIDANSIAYIEGKEEAKSGYIRFKDEASAEEFAKLSRGSDSFSARVLPESQQASYWEKANRDRIAKLSRKKNERGSDKIARKVFERNKVTFQAKGSHVVFGDDDDDNNTSKDDSKECHDGGDAVVKDISKSDVGEDIEVDVENKSSET